MLVLQHQAKLRHDFSYKEGITCRIHKRGQIIQNVSETGVYKVSMFSLARELTKMCVFLRESGATCSYLKLPKDES